MYGGVSCPQASPRFERRRSAHDTMRRVPGIGLITNPRSRVNQREPGRARRLSYLDGSHGNAEATKTIDDLYRVCEEFKKERIDVLGISGGDGTMQHTLTAMIR